MALSVNNSRSTTSPPVVHTHEATSDENSDYAISQEIVFFGDASPGVLRAGILYDTISRWDKVRIFLSLFLVAYVYGLDSTLRYVYQPYATSALQSHSSLATLNVVRAVIAAAAQFSAAKIADICGRLQLLLITWALYVIGTAIEATAHDVKTFIAGAVIYQLGFTMIILLAEIIIADISTLQSRLLSTYVPNLQVLINTWVSGDITEAVLQHQTWRKGIGMWAGIFTGVCMPLAISLWLPLRRAKRDPAIAAQLRQYPSLLKSLSSFKSVKVLFEQMDLLGLVGLTIIFGLVLVPFTVAGGAQERWQTPGVFVSLAFGVIFFLLWIWWERRAGRYALVPFRLLRDRAVWAALGVACMLNFCWSLQADFLYTVLIVAFGESTKSASRIVALYSFCSVLTGTIVGFIVYFFKQLKPFIVCGTLLFAVAFGLLIKYRGGPSETNHYGVIGAQVVLGIAGGLFPFPTLTSIQAATRHEHLAVVTGLYLSMFNIGAALGNAVSGALWTQLLVPTLLSHLPEPYNTMVFANGIYENPFDYATSFPMGTPVRDAMVISYRDIQFLTMVTGICLCGPLVMFSFLIRNPVLGKEQSHSDAIDLRSEARGSGSRQGTRRSRFIDMIKLNA